MGSIDRRFLDLRVCIDGIVTAPANDAATGTQYLVASASATGDFAGHEDEVAYKTASGWKFYAPAVGQMELFNLADVKFYRYETDGTDSEWVGYDIGASRVLESVVALVTSGAGAPSGTPTAGDIYVDTENNKIYVATAEGWPAQGTDPTPGLRYASKTSKKILVARGNTFSSEDVGDTIMFVCKQDNNIYAYDADTADFVNLTSIEDNPDYKRHTVIEVVTLDADAISSKSVDLSKLAVLADGVAVFVGGVCQVPTVDFTVANDAGNTTTTISWTGKGLAEIPLTVDDKFVVHYSTIQD